MKRSLLIALLFLAACQDETTAPAPIALTEEALGHYCQMNLLEHDGPKGQIHLEGLPAPLFFAQVRDTMAYLHMPEQSHAVTIAYVQDMAGASWTEPGPWISAKDAIYVVGSRMKGGMGASEFVPFSNRAEAESFAAEHGGSLRAFSDISAAEALAPDMPEPSPGSEGGDIARRLQELRN
ncbi:MAG: nitrous oxide reductase accessory protein NosL [Pseudorhodobacter sp.]